MSRNRIEQHPEEYRADLNPEYEEGENYGPREHRFRTAYDIKDLHERLRDFRALGALDAVRESLSLMDDTRRIAIFETDTTVDGEAVDNPAALRRFQFGNHLGTCLLEVDEVGGVITYEEFYYFGCTSYQATRAGLDRNPKIYRYTGQRRDLATGLYLNGVRYYAPWLARWTSPDPAGSVDGPNLYAYSGNNPVSHADPTGMQQVSNGLDPRDPRSYATIEDFISGYQTSEQTSVDPEMLRAQWTLIHSPTVRMGSSNAQLADESRQSETSASSSVAERFQGLLRSQVFERDADQSSMRNYLIGAYESIASASPVGYTGNIYSNVLPPSATEANYSAAAAFTAQDPVNNTVRWTLQQSLLQYGIEFGYQDLAERAASSTEFSYQIHESAFSFANNVSTIGRLPWTLLTAIDVPALGMDVGPYIYGPSAFVGGLEAGFQQFALNPTSPDMANAAFARAYAAALQQQSQTLGGRMINWTIENTNSPHGVWSLPWYGIGLRWTLNAISFVTYPFYD